MITAREELLRELAAHPERQGGMWPSQPTPQRVRHVTGPYWSPAVAAGMLGITLLAGISLLIVLLTSIR